ncbi:TOLL-like receptor [Chamberlinius hualienensis]
MVAIISICFILYLCFGLVVVQVSKMFQTCKLFKYKRYAELTMSNRLNENSSIFMDYPVKDLWTTDCNLDNSSRISLGDENPIIHYQNEMEDVRIISSKIKKIKNDYFCYFANVTSLNLTDNYLVTMTDIGVGAVSDNCDKKCCLCRLKTLSLRGNLLKNLTKSSFCQLRSVMHLDLNNCQLERIDFDAFSLLKDLKTISLKSNHLTQLDLRTFVRNLLLNSIELNNNQLSEIPAIGHLKNMDRFYIVNNRITSLSKNEFQNWTNVSIMYLSHNGISYIEPGTFNNMKILVDLYLHDNSIETLNDSFSSANITNLFLQSNHIKAISFNQFSPFTKQVQLKNNMISILQTTPLWNGSMNYLDLSMNTLTSLTLLFLPTSLEYLDLRLTGLTEFSFHPDYYELVESHQTKLRAINLNYNQLNMVPYLPYKNVNIGYDFDGNILKCSCANAWRLWNYHIFTDLLEPPCKLMINFTSYNDLEVDYGSSLSVNDLYCQSNMFRNHKCVRQQWDSEFLQCKQGCPESCQCFVRLNYTHVDIVCSNRHLESVPHKFDDRNYYIQLEIVVRLDGNYIKTIFSGDFVNYKNAVALLLNSSNIHSIDPFAFHYLHLLRVLNMDSNNLKYINKEVFEDLTNLQELYLSNNKIAAISDGVFKNLHLLQTIHLHNNNLVAVPVSDFWNLRLINQLTVYGNNWSCDCDFILTFKNYLQDSLVVAVNESQLLCYFDDTSLNINDVNNNNCIKSVFQHDSNSLMWIVWVSILAVCVIILSLTTVAFVYRYEMVVLVYSRLNVRLFNRSSRANEVDGKVFDAFIAYSNVDLDFIAQNILPKLEEIENPYLVCLHDRNFMGGGTISTHVEEAIRISSRTIIVLTENFLRSGWCRFEFQVAHVQLLEEKCKRLLVILVGELPQEIDPEIKLYLRTYTYLKWGDKWFWEKLYYSMPDHRVSRPENGDIPLIPLES